MAINCVSLILFNDLYFDWTFFPTHRSSCWVHLLYLFFSIILKATSFKKCELGDSVCLTRTFTDFVQNPKSKSIEVYPVIIILNELICMYACSLPLEYPGLKIPKIDPYKQSRPFTVRSFKATPFITVSAYWTNITVYGLDKAICQQIRWLSVASIIHNKMDFD